jgi:hypothetical protein
MLMAHTLLKLGDTSRKIYLYDTFTGMAKPSEKDVSILGRSALQDWHKFDKGDVNEWRCAFLEEVKNNIYSTGYPQENIILVKGLVEETIPAVLPEKIALLRLDTDWYESTYYELIHMYPVISPQGVLIIDDYGCWKGAKEAVDKYLEENNINILLNRIDYTGRIAIKNL